MSFERSNLASLNEKLFFYIDQNKLINDYFKFQEYEDWKNVKKAHQNASQIIKRIKSDIKEIKKIRNQIGLVIYSFKIFHKVTFNSFRIIL